MKVYGGDTDDSNTSQDLYGQDSGQSAGRSKKYGICRKGRCQGLVYLSRFILRLLKQLDDEVIELCAEAEDQRS